jgi:micrococcal nuclease
MLKRDTWLFPAKLLRVVDGDTLDFEVDLGFRTFARIRVRLKGVDTPEVYGVKKDSAEYAKGQEASEFTKAWFAEHGDECWLATEKATGKYGRWIAEVGTPDAQSLNQALIDAGYESESK